MTSPGWGVGSVPPATARTAAAASTRPAPQPEQDPDAGRAVCFRIASICAGVSEGFADFMSAATPATCGAAIEVPCIQP